MQIPLLKSEHMLFTQVGLHLSFCHNCDNCSEFKRLNENGSIWMRLQEISETAGIDALRVVACAHDAKWALRS